VPCHPGTNVGDYVPFYFCPRSVMLYVVHMANHPELAYRDGQGPIVHLEADLYDVIRWANRSGRRWAFSLSNAGAYYAEFQSTEADLDRLDWEVIAATDFRAPEVKEGKQASSWCTTGSRSILSSGSAYTPNRSARRRSARSPRSRAGPP
jgi:hypothetical protein